MGWNGGGGGVTLPVSIGNGGTGAQTAAGALAALAAGAVQTYTPTWTVSSGTQPVLGNGILTGRYMILDKFLWLRIALEAGSTTTFGTTGSYMFSLPNGVTVATLLDGNAFDQYLEGTLVLSNARYATRFGVQGAAPGTWRAYPVQAASSTWTPVAPAAMAAGDTCCVEGILNIT